MVSTCQSASGISRKARVAKKTLRASLPSTSRQRAAARALWAFSSAACRAAARSRAANGSISGTGSSFRLGMTQAQQQGDAGTVVVGEHAAEHGDALRPGRSAGDEHL